MPETNEREALARVLPAWMLGIPAEHQDRWPWVTIATRYNTADAILASDWLKAHTAAVVERERAACEAVAEDAAEMNLDAHEIAKRIAARKAQP